MPKTQLHQPRAKRTKSPSGLARGADSTSPAKKPKAYSYLRFSTADQIQGDSFRRQTELARAWCAKTGIPLVDNYRDLGVSAFRAANADKGALKAFLDRVESGVIEPGSYLIVESLDRLSRTDITFALQMFLGLVNAGIIVVTLADERVYDRQRINDGNFTDIIISLTILSRANEESRMKSSRLCAAWANKRNRITEEKMTAQCPAWLRLSTNRKGFDLVEEKAAIVRRIFEMAAQGKGKQGIARVFNAEGVPCMGDGVHWYPSTIGKILDSRAVIGEFQPGRMVSGKREVFEPVADYYPAAISMELYATVQRIRRERPSYRGRGTTNPIAGLVYNVMTGNKMIRISKGPKWIYLVDSAAQVGAAPYITWRFDQFMESLLTVCEAATDAPAVPHKQNPGLAAALKRIGEIEAQVPRLVEFIAGGFSASVDAKLRGMEKEKAELEKQLAELHSEQSAGDIDLQKVNWRDDATLKETARAVIRRIDVHPVERWFKVTIFDGREVLYTESSGQIEIASNEPPPSSLRTPKSKKSKS